MEDDLWNQADRYLKKVEAALAALDREAVAAFVEQLDAVRARDGWTYTCGNGGSAATASHFVGDLMKGASYGKPTRSRAMCLTDNASTLLAYANDLSYDAVFVEPLINLLTPNDLVIGISGSGNSRNVIKAIEYANRLGAVTVGLCGYDGGRLKTAARHSVHVELDDMLVVEDVHMALCHLAASLHGAGRLVRPVREADDEWLEAA